MNTNNIYEYNWREESKTTVPDYVWLPDQVLSLLKTRLKYSEISLHKNNEPGSPDKDCWFLL